MFADGSKIAIPLWAERQPPNGLSEEWNGIYRALVDPVTVVMTFRHSADRVRRGTPDLFAAWHDTLCRSVRAAATVLRFLHGHSQRSWRAGHKINTAITPIVVSLGATAQYLTRPTPSRNGPEATADSLRTNAAQKLLEFDAESLLDELALAVKHDCDLQRGLTASDGNGPRKISTPAKSQPRLNQTEKKILSLCRRRHYKGELLANKVGLAYDYARRVFAKLVKAKLLRNDENGYRTV